MCIAIEKPSGSQVSEEHLKNSFLRNPDGAGYAFIDTDGKLLVRKGFMDFDSFMTSYIADVSVETTAIIHFRIKSVGNISAENCHPWLISCDGMAEPEEGSGEICFIHNGTLTDFIDPSSDYSDTRNFRDRFLHTVAQEQGYDFLETPWIYYSIIKIAGSSKFVFLDKDGRTTVINRELGTEHEGCWFSNESFKNPPSNKKSSSTNLNSGSLQQFFVICSLNNAQAGFHEGQVITGQQLYKFLDGSRIKGQHPKKLRKALQHGILKPFDPSID